MDALQIFTNDQFGEIRTIQEGDKILFCGSDVAKALGYARPAKAIQDHCKGVLKQDILTAGGLQQMHFISEGDVYRLITKSSLPSAEKFESWVFDEVLPSIRKHGAYMTQEVIEQAILNPDTIIQLAMALKEEQTRNNELQNKAAQQQQIIGELKPKADYTDRILRSEEAIAITQIAKDYGMSGSRMNQILFQEKIQYKVNGQWLLYARYQSCGYTQSETIEYMHNDGTMGTTMSTKWTQKGRLFLYNALKQSDILPTIELTSQIIINTYPQATVQA